MFVGREHGAGVIGSIYHEHHLQATFFYDHMCRFMDKQDSVSTILVLWRHPALKN